MSWTEEVDGAPYGEIPIKLYDEYSYGALRKVCYVYIIVINSQ